MYKDRLNIRKINIASLINNLPFENSVRNCIIKRTLRNDIKSRVIYLENNNNTLEKLLVTKYKNARNEKLE